MKNPKPKPKPDTPPTKKPPGSANDKNVGKVLDVAKQGLATLSSVAGVFTERERTRQAEVKAHADVRKAEEQTSQRRIAAQQRLSELVVEDKKNAMDHQRAMQSLANQQAVDAARIRQQDQVLDRILNTPEDSPQLAQSLRALLSKPDGS